MSNISGITDKTVIFKKSAIGTADKDAFRLTLESTIENNVNRTDKAGGIKYLGEIRAPASNVVRLNSENEILEMTYKTNSLLELLDNYSKELDNPNRTLRDIEPLISTIKKDAEHLLADTEVCAIGADEIGIKELAGRCAVAANIEYIKFQRGDYL